MSAGDMLTTKDVMGRLGYSCRTSFWQMVKREGVPHVRINARVIKFEPGPLEEWLEKRRSVKSPARF